MFLQHGHHQRYHPLTIADYNPPSHPSTSTIGSGHIASCVLKPPVYTPNQADSAILGRFLFPVGGVTAHFLLLVLQPARWPRVTAYFPFRTPTSARRSVGARCLRGAGLGPLLVWRESVAAGGAAARRRRLVCGLWVSLTVLVRQCWCGGGLKFTRIQHGYHTTLVDSLGRSLQKQHQRDLPLEYSRTNLLQTGVQ
jgi:hypothetical protein